MTETAFPPLASSAESPSPRQLPRWAVLLVAALLVGSWSVWALHAYRAHPPVVSVAELRSDLASGTVRTYVGLTEFRNNRVWPADDDLRISTAPIPEPGAPTTSNDRPIIALMYYLDASRSPMRVVFVAPFGQAEPGAVGVHELVHELDAAGIQPREEFVPSMEWHANPWAEWAQVWGTVTGLLALLALFAIRPKRGTRWFWFWVFGVPLGLGVVAYAVLECVLPRRSDPVANDRPSKGRLIGVVGFAVAGATKLLIPL